MRAGESRTRTAEFPLARDDAAEDSPQWLAAHQDCARSATSIADRTEWNKEDRVVLNAAAHANAKRGPAVNTAFPGRASGQRYFAAAAAICSGNLRQSKVRHMLNSITAARLGRSMCISR
jgi:hypothetical protein